MASRPRRSAATKASESISVHAKWADASDKSERNIMASRRSGRASGASAMRDLPSSPSDSHISVNVKTSSSKSRQPVRGSARRAEAFDGGAIVSGTRNRGGRKNYVIDSSPDDEGEEEEEAEIDDAEDDDMDDEEDAEGEEMEVDAEGEDVDAEGEEDAEGDVDMGIPVRPTATTIRVSQPSSSRAAARAAASKIEAADDEDDDEDDDDDDDELSDPGESDDGGDQTLGFGDDTMADEEEVEDEDAEGEEIEVAGDDDVELDAEGDDAAAGIELDSDEDGSRAATPDLNKMTKRQRARFEDEPQEYMKLSDGKSSTLLRTATKSMLTIYAEVQVKKHFTAEELSMRRQEMARRRRNLSDKRTEEVKVCALLADSTSHHSLINLGYRWKPSTSCSRSKRPRSTARPHAPAVPTRTS